MTWVKGTSTWGAIEHLLAQLACGEVADGSATTVGASDRWVRETTRTIADAVLNSTTTITSATAAFTVADVGSLVIGTGLTLGTTIASVTNGTTAVLSAAATATASGVAVQITTNTIRTPASKDVNTGACSGRAGYWLNVGQGNTPMVAGSPGINTVCRTTGLAASNPASANFGRWVVMIRISTANSVAGNYSTAQFAVASYDLDAGTNYTNTTGTLTAAGTATLNSGCGSIPISITDPSGLLTGNTYFIRAFTSTYVGGVDCWPMWHRSAAATPTFTVAPPGVAGTDYDVIAQAYASTTDANVAASGGTLQRANLLHGLGIKTITGLGANPLYTLSHPLALVKLRMFSSSNGVLSLDLGQSKKDAVNSVSTFRACGGYRITSWLKCFSTPGSVSAGTPLQYWASITADGIVVAVNGDTAATGKLGAAFVCSYVPTEPTYDVLPVIFNTSIGDYTADYSSDNFHPATQYGYWSLRRRQDGSEASVNRDWQTRWLRGEHMSTLATVNASGMIGNGSDAGSGVTAAEPGGSSQVPQLSSLGLTSNNASGTTSTPMTAPARQNKPSPDGKWWLYGFQYGEWSWFNVNMATASESRLLRGSMTTRFLFIPADNWGSGDELLDSVSGIKYLLLTPDYLPNGMARVRTSVNTYYGGVAIAEI